MYRHSMLLYLALGSCGGSVIPQHPWPALTGHETLAQLQQAHDQKMMYQGKRLLASWVDCTTNRNVVACQWLSAFWKADYADASAKCNEGDTDSCETAASYALGCEVRGIWSGSERDTREFSENNTGPGCQRAGAIPFDLVTYPRIDVARALELIATPCKRDLPETASEDDRAHAYISCDLTAELMLSGIVDGIEIPGDRAVARSFFERARMIEGGYDKDPEGLEHAWHRLADKYLDESPEERSERIDSVKKVYEAENASSNRLAAETVDLQTNSSVWPSVMAGLQAGLATTAAVNQNLATAQANINATVAASNAQAKQKREQQRATTVAAQQQQQQQRKDQQQRQQQQELEEQQQQQKADKKSKLEACLDDHENCEYGDSNRCEPSVPYGDRFGSRRVAMTIHNVAELCESKGSMSWGQDCYAPKIKPVLDASNFLTLADSVRDVANRLGKLPDRYKKDMPACWGQLLPIPQVVTDLPKLCQSAKSTCIDACNNADRQLECAREVDDFLYHAEFQQHRDALKASHDAECHRKYD